MEETAMLVLSRKKHEEIVIGDNVVVSVVDIRAGKVRLGIQAPKEVPVHRKEIQEILRRAGPLGDPVRRRRDPVGSSSG
jgi:carbon storage regulator